MALADSTGPRRILTGLLGYPIAHSASPAMHEAAGRAAGLDVRYHLIERDGLDEAALRVVLAGLPALGFAGINVTFPYKERIAPLLDRLSPQAAALGAVNTIVVEDGALVGHNTDCTGFRTVCARIGARVRSGPAALIGAGGVGRAMAVAMLETGVPELRVLDRDAAKAAGLAHDLKGLGVIRACASLDDALADCTGIVNATPVGMKAPQESPIPADRLHGGLWVADAVYVPLWTRLLRDARARGALTVTGRDLAIRQAVDAFALMTGVAASEAEMSTAFDRIVPPVPDGPIAA